MLELTDLTVNASTSPFGIGAAHVAFGWKLVSPAPDTLQTRYRIRASSAGAIIWDSGRVEDGRCFAVPWAGPKLTSRQRVTWTVQVWDNHGNVAEAVSAFEIGLLTPEDWQARFIELADEQDPLQRHPAVLFRREFTLARRPVRARLYATAHGNYEARLNAQRVSPALFTPGFTVYDRRLQVQTYDVMPLLRAGVNVIGALVTDGWYRGSHGSHQKTNSFGTQLAFLARLELVFEDGTTQVVATDQNWFCGTGSIQLCDLHLGVRIDAALEPHGWDGPEFDAVKWRQARVVAHDLRRLCPQEGPMSQVTQEIAGIEVLQTPDGSTVVDFGQNLVGHVRFTINGTKGHEIRMLPVETLDEHGNAYARTTVMPEFGGKVAKYEKHWWIFRLSGNRADVFDTRHTFTGFRYLVIEGWPGRLAPADLTACVVHSDMRQTGSFGCSDSRVNRLQQNIVWSLRGNFIEIPTDCPGREKAGWTGDMYNFVATATLNRDVCGVLRRWMKDVVADQDKRGDGRVTCVSPNTRTYQEGIAHKDGSAGWADAVVKVPWVLYQHYGDPQILAESYPAILKWIAFCDQRAQVFGRAAYRVPRRLFNPWHWRRNRHLITTGGQYGDWFRPGENLAVTYARNELIPPVFEATALYAMSLEMVARIARILGQDDDAQRMRARHAQVVEAFRGEFMRTKGRLAIDEQYAYVLALAFDLLPESARQAAANRLVELLAANGYRLKTGFVSTPYVLPQLTRFGHHAVAAKLLMQDQRPSWLYEVDRGATTIWESWDGIDESGKVLPASLNHFSLGSVGQWLCEQVAGLQATVPGYRRMRIAPKPTGGLSYCSYTLETPCGLARSSWRIDGSSFLLAVRVPPNTRAEVQLPDGTKHEVGSGSHQFTTQLEPELSRSAWSTRSSLGQR